MKWLVERLHPTFVDEDGRRGVVSTKVVDADTWFDARHAFVKADVDPTLDPMSSLIRCGLFTGKQKVMR